MSKQNRKPFSGWFPLVCMYVVQIVWGVMACFPLGGVWHWVYSLLLASLAAMWVVLDARHRGKPLVSIVQLIVMVFWQIAVPIYLIATRGLSGLGWTILNLIGLVIAHFIGFYSTVLAVWGPEGIWPPT